MSELKPKKSSWKHAGSPLEHQKRSREHENPTWKHEKSS